METGQATDDAIDTRSTARSLPLFAVTIASFFSATCPPDAHAAPMGAALPARPLAPEPITCFSSEGTAASGQPSAISLPYLSVRAPQGGVYREKEGRGGEEGASWGSNETCACRAMLLLGAHGHAGREFIH